MISLACTIIMILELREMEFHHPSLSIYHLVWKEYDSGKTEDFLVYSCHARCILVEVVCGLLSTKNNKTMH